jgi:hypothetical protein
LTTSSRLEITSSLKRRFFNLAEQRTTGFEFGGLAYITVSQVDDANGLHFLHFILVILSTFGSKLLESPPLFHINCSIGRTRDLHVELLAIKKSTYLIEINLLSLLSGRSLLGLSESSTRNICNDFLLEVVLLFFVRVSLEKT